MKVAVVSAYFNTFRDSIVSISHCPDNYVPGLLQDMEMYDLSGLVAPRRAVRRVGAEATASSRSRAVETAAAKARENLSALRRPDRFGYEIHDGAHEVHLVGAFDFLSRRL